MVGSVPGTLGTGVGIVPPVAGIDGSVGVEVGVATGGSGVSAVGATGVSLIGVGAAGSGAIGVGSDDGKGPPTGAAGSGVGSFAGTAVGSDGGGVEIPVEGVDAGISCGVGETGLGVSVIGGVDVCPLLSIIFIYFLISAFLCQEGKFGRFSHEVKQIIISDHT